MLRLPWYVLLLVTLLVPAAWPAAVQEQGSGPEGAEVEETAAPREGGVEDGGEGAQADPEAEEGTEGQEGGAAPGEGAEPGAAEEDAPEVAEGERVLRLDDDLEADRASLAELEGTLAERERFFEELTAAERRLSEDLAAKEEQGESEELDELRQRVARVTTQLELTLQSLRALRDQREALALKLEQGLAARNALLGLDEEGQTPASRSAPPASQGARPGGTTGAGLPVPVPGLPPQGGSAPGGEAPEEAPRTAEQVEAAQEAAKLASRAAEAEQAVLDFLDRKDTLEEQIALEQVLLDTARASRENFEGALAEREAALGEELDGDGDPQELASIRESIATVRELAVEARQEVDSRTDRLATLRQRLIDLEAEQRAVTAEARERRDAAEEAQRRSIWLRSPFHPRNILEWAIERGPRILMVIAFAMGAVFLIRLTLGRIARTVIRRGRSDREGATNRAHTLSSSFRSASTVLICLIAFLLVLQEAGLDIKTVLGGAAILGVSVAFGAQNLMRDYFTGFLILLEDQFEIGDLVSISGVTGTVERVNMRTTMLRDLEGRMHFIPNGEIKAVTNRTYVWGRAVLEVPVGFDEDVDRVMQVILDVAQELSTDPDFAEAVIEEPQMLGVDKFTEAGVIIKFMLRTAPASMFLVRREMLRRIKNRFDELGIRISVPHRRVVAPADQGREPGPSA